MSFLILITLALKAQAATWYIDNTATGLHNGTSWSNAWTAISQISGVKAGDIVYISGGPKGSSQTYSISNWTPPEGSAATPITYQIGQDSSHGGTAIFIGSGSFLGIIQGASPSEVSNVVISGNAGDGKMHFQTNGYDNIMGDDAPTTNLRLSYINFGNMNGTNAIAATASGFEFDHNYVYMDGSMTDAILSMGFTGTGYDQNLIHDNIMYSPTAGGAIGADGLQFSGNGFSIYNNTLISYVNSSWNVNEGQHSDGWQTGGGSYIKIYGNLIYGYGDIGIYGGCWGNAVPGGSHIFEHVMIYNNIIDAPNIIAAGDISIEADDPTNSTFSDIGIYNNTLRVPPCGSPAAGYYGYGIYIGSNLTGGTWSNINVQNNLVISPSQLNFIDIQHATANSSNNVYMTVAQAEATLINLQPGTSTSDYHPKSTATSLIGQGVNESSYFITDKDDNSRPSNGAWAIGAYEYTTDTTSTSMQIHNNGFPAQTTLEQNYPNPFNPVTTISYQLSASSFVKLSVYNMLGREVAILVNKKKVPGIYTTTWNATGFAVGMYIAQLRAGIEVKTIKLSLIK